MEDNKNKYTVIIAGGRGERFWPQSRLSRPKHLLPIVGEKSMLNQTMDRLQGLIPTNNIYIITNKEQVDAVKTLCPNIPPENIVAEPVGRDTAAAIALAAKLIKAKNPQGIFSILPADHIVRDTQEFRSCLLKAYEAAQKYRALVTIGIKPTNPATGYGYIQTEKELERDVFEVKRFVEKPNIEKAQEYLNEGNYFWNGGIFVWQVETIEAALSKQCPEIYTRFEKLEKKDISPEERDLILQEIYPPLKKISIDYAVMEKAQNVITVKAKFDWDDVGEWPAIERHFAPDSSGNVVKGNAIVRDAHRNIVINEDGHLTAVLGVEDLIIVQTKDATLICPKNRAQEIKALVKQITTHPEHASRT